MLLKNTIEIFLFVNPLGTSCYGTEKLIEEFSNEREEKVSVRFIPVLNFRTIGNILTDKVKLNTRNELYTASYNASIAFQAASMQGKKKGRQFLMALQNKLLNENRTLSDSLFFEVADQVKLDREMFEEDLYSDFSKKAFKKDQQLALDMDVEEAPSCVLYAGNEADYGYRINTSITKQLLHGICDDQAAVQEKFQAKHLSLLQMV